MKLPKIGERVEVASKYVIKAGKLLDIGCGSGEIIFFVKDRVSKIYGVDNSRKKLELAKRNGLITKAFDLNDGKLPYKDFLFEVVTCLDVLEHIKNPVKLSREVYRVLKKNGAFILSTPNIRFSGHLFSLIFKGRFPKTSDNKEAYDGGHIHYFAFSDLRSILKKAGFKITHERGIINKAKRGFWGQFFKIILGEKFMREFRSQGILIVAKKVK